MPRQSSYHGLLFLQFLFFPPIHGAISDVFNTQPAACETCLTPVYNACEASIGPFGPANAAAFAACICATPSLARVAGCGASRGTPCSDTFRSVAEAAQTWCLWNSEQFRHDVCASVDENGRSSFRYIPGGVLGAVCEGKDGGVVLSSDSDTSSLVPAAKETTEATGIAATMAIIGLTSPSVAPGTLSFVDLTATAPEIPKPTESLATNTITSLFTASSLLPQETATRGTTDTVGNAAHGPDKEQPQDSPSSKIGIGVEFAAAVIAVVCLGLS